MINISQKCKENTMHLAAYKNPITLNACQIGLFNSQYIELKPNNFIHNQLCIYIIT